MPHTKISRPPIAVIGPSIAYVPLTRGQFSLIDSDSIPFVEHLTWKASWRKQAQCFYAEHSSKVGRKVVGKMMHSVVMGCDTTLFDHINRNTLDNRRCNLRPASRALNRLNCTKKTVNKTGFDGVSLVTGGGYQAKIRVYGKRVSLGHFTTAEEAGDAYRQARTARIAEEEFLSSLL